MPAEITNTNGRDEMFYVGKTPWHGLGTQLDSPTTAAEAIEAAGLDWNVEMVPVFLGDGTEVPGKRAAIRADTAEVFNVMSDLYTPMQNVEAFQFFDGVVGAGEAIYHTAGSLRGGRKVWALAKLPGELKVSNQDVLEKYVLLANGHDGSLAVTMQLTAVRVVCHNTMSLALGEGQKFRALHTPNVMSRINEAREALQLQEAYFAVLERQVERLASAAFLASEREEFLVKLFGQKENTEAISTRMKNQMGQVSNLFESGMGNKGESRWDMLNAVTEFVDHHRGPRGSVDMDAQGKRLHSAWFGAGAQLKQRAWDLLQPAATAPGGTSGADATPLDDSRPLRIQ